MEGDALAQAEAIIEATQEAKDQAHGVEVGRLIATSIDRSLQSWIVQTGARHVTIARQLGVGDQTEEIMNAVADRLRFWAGELGA